MPTAKQSLRPKGLKKIATSPLATRSSQKKPVASSEKRVASTLSVPVYSLVGAKSATTLALPKELFGGKINEPLLKQAVRVYLNNQKGHHSHTKTRGEVSYTTAKMWKQKGTGRARHGAKSAPIFVGGGVALGARSRNIILELPKKIRKAALIAALSLKAKDGQILGVAGLDKATKTKEIALLMSKVGKRTNLVLGDSKMESAQRAVRNLPNTKFTSGLELNTLDVVKFQNLIVTKEGLDQLVTRVKNQESREGKNA